MTQLDIQKLTPRTKDLIGSFLVKEGLTIQQPLGHNPVVWKNKSDFLMLYIGYPYEEEPEEIIEVKTFDEFIEWWPSIKKGLGMET